MCRTLLPDPDTRALRDALGHYATGVAIVTATGDEGTPVGMTINSFTSVSMTPPLVAWCVDRRAASYRIFAGATRFSISVLAAHQADLARRFATRGEDKFRDINWRTSAPVMEGSCAHFCCETYSRVLLGDHLMLVGKVTDFDSRATSPLLFARGEFQSLPATVAGDIAA